MKKSELIFSFLLIPLDFLMLIGAAMSAYFLRLENFFNLLRIFNVIIPPAQYNFTTKEFFLWSVLISGISMVIFALYGLYKLKSTRGSLQETYRTIISISTALIAVVFFLFLDKTLFSSRSVILTAWIIAILFVSLGRMLLREIQRYFLKYGYGVHRLIVIGANGVGEKIYHEFARPNNLAYCVMAYLKNNQDIFEKIEKIKNEKGVDEIIQTDPQISNSELISLREYCDEKNLVFKYVPNLFEAQATNIDINTVSGIPVIEIKDTPLDGWGRIAKRIIDIFGSLFLIIFFSPLMIITAVIIKLDSRGPIFFSKFKGKKIMRAGQFGEPFHYFKFRSMQNETHDMRYTALSYNNIRQGTPMVKIKNDPRVTRIGKFIRRFSIDELPEFFLVFIGKMSLVGPRPHLLEEVEKYQKHHRHVLKIKPGITGLAQISGRSDLNFEDEVKLDSYYIENWSLKKDFRILLRTPQAVLKKREAL